MPSKPDPVRSVEFIFAECRRLQERMLSGEKVVPNSPEAMEFFHRIPHPEVSWSFQICGRAADETLYDLARKAAAHAGINHQVSAKTIRDKLGEIIVRKFQTEKLPLDRKNVDRALSEAAKTAARSRKNITHYIPCHLMHAQKPDEFSIGPVRFRPQHLFRQALLRAVSSSRKDLKKSRFYISRVLKYYRSFRWVAEVEITNSDKETSANIAALSVAAALDCLHLLLEPKYTHKMSIGGPNLSVDWRGKLAVLEGGDLSYSAGFEGAGSVSFDDDWFQRFENEDYAHALHLCGVALENVTDPSLDRPLSRRFLDAILWFGEAVRERSRAAKVIKYATALERMVMTDEKDDITGTMSQRVAAICCENPLGGFDRWLADAQKLYSLRSKLVHGSLSPHSNDIGDGIALGARLGGATLLHTLFAFGEVGLRDEHVSQRRLAKWFNDFVAQILDARLWQAEYPQLKPGTS